MFIKNQLSILLIFLIGLLSFEGLSQCTDIDNGNYWSESWMSCSVSPNPNLQRGNSHWILFEFEQPESINSTTIWNANKTGKSIYGVKDIIIDYSTGDDINWIQLGQFQFPKATEQGNYGGFTGPHFQGIHVKKILFTVLSNHSAGVEDCVSLSEVKFKINENACYAQEDACGVCDGPGPTTWYKDADGDGLGDINNSLTNCNQPTGYVTNANDNCDNGLPGWPEVSLIFQENGCTNCHGTTASGGLDLRSYETALLGGDKCGNAILQGTTLVDIITIDGYNACGTPIELPAMNTRTGGNLNNVELASLQKWIDLEYPQNCYCLSGSTDADNDGICDAIDVCPNFNDAIIGQPCNDGNACTDNDVWLESCKCGGEPTADFDNDGVCDNEDVAPFNPCTADGTADGIEPANWIQLPANDCDNDFINISNGDLNDFDACSDNFGQSTTADCLCGNDAQVAGGKYQSSNKVTLPVPAQGLPDGIFTSSFGGTSSITLTYPNLSIGEEICFTVGFSQVEGAVNFDVNFNSFSFLNANSNSNFAPQQFCLNTLQSGFHTVIITSIGVGHVKVDGSSYTYCSCSESDYAFNTPNCKCKNSKTVEGALIDYATDFNNTINANGLPDGILTGNIENTDTLILSCPNLSLNSEVCISLAFNNVFGAAVLKVDDQSFNLPNYKSNIYFQPQQFCFLIEDAIDKNLELYNVGEGLLRIDGANYSYCPDCDLSVNTFVTHQTIEKTANGSVGVNIIGGVPPFTVNWNTGDTGNTLDNIYPGSYLVEINDAAGCTVFETLEVESYYCNNFSIAVNTTPETSYFYSDGTALSLISGGEAPYSYNWSVNQNDSIATDLTEGVYSLNVLDVNGCSRDANFEIETLQCPEHYVQTDTTQLTAGIYKVNNFIQTNGFVVENENVLLKAPNYIQLNNNFEVVQGANFEILIDDCQ